MKTTKLTIAADATTIFQASASGKIVELKGVIATPDTLGAEAAFTIMEGTGTDGAAYTTAVSPLMPVPFAHVPSSSMDTPLFRLTQGSGGAIKASGVSITVELMWKVLY